MTFYAHTAEDEKGNRLPEESGKWQRLDVHLRNVADLAAKFAAPFGAIKETLLPPAITPQQASLIYANEAVLLNVALFGQTAKQWRDTHPKAEGNVRDHAALEQLVVLTNLESLNCVFIRQGLLQPERLRQLNGIAITQMRTLLAANNVKRLK